jgi:hypothetical protein
METGRRKEEGGRRKEEGAAYQECLLLMNTGQVSSKVEQSGTDQGRI